MSKNIPEQIQPDMHILWEITQGKRRSVINEQGLKSEVAVYGDSECGGLMLVFNSPNSLSHSTGEFDYDLFLRTMDSFYVDTDHLFGNTHTLTTEVTWEGVEPAEFTCIYDFDTAKGLPASMYQAYAYLRSQLNLPLETFLEIFGAITTALPLINLELFRSGDFDTMGGNFNVEKALAHDMQTQQLITA